MSLILIEQNTTSRLLVNSRELSTIGTDYQRKQYLHRARVPSRRTWTIGWTEIGIKSYLLPSLLTVTVTINIARAFCEGTRRYGVPGNENDESIVLYVSILLGLVGYDKLIMAYRHLFEGNITNVSNPCKNC